MPTTFANPPINEVVVGVGFAPRRDLLVPHFGEYWDLIRDQFPKVEHATPFAFPGNVRPIEAESFFLPRVWYLSEDTRRLVQLQQDVFMVNWRQLATPAEYPRFPAIRSTFERTFTTFSEYVERRTGVPLQVERLHLAYINALLQGEGWDTLANADQVLRDGLWQPGNRFLPTPTKAAWSFDFDMPGKTVLSAKLAMASRVSDQKPILRLEIAANKLVQEEIDLFAWIDAAHDMVVSAFRDLTTTEVQRGVWKLMEP